VDVTEHISTLLTDTFGVDPFAIGDDVPLRRLRMDSLALEELRLLLEDGLDIDLDDVQLSSRDTFGALVTAVREKKAVVA
jgi:acyl carrier protein